ncbi:ribosome small subunit-dependent GTPase A [Candidatus Aerophobetes bacterium]|uniref:Small ribosomal subunit biogenesis GTPase RsgA n=1 Tax=Aerophobetes bacterium TaxID=2030807 RepID=A0A2A4YMB1_UNCAE|nr:MAG: ribosome small subunit-dependent GTPase A [Candidatus Aerophobetes bacterium]
MPKDIDNDLNIEEDFYDKDRKFERKYRKMVSTRDRSKYKKTDQDNLNKKKKPHPALENPDLRHGRVLAISAEGIVVDSKDASYICSLKGALKKEKTKKKNLIAVGDIVYFEDTQDGSGVINYVTPRHSILSRADNLRRNKEQLIAVNIDQVLITVSVFLPKLKPSLVDRYIIAAKNGNMHPVIVLNKIDLIKNPPKGMDPAHIEKERYVYNQFIKVYSKLNVPIYEVSCEDKTGIEELNKVMQGKASVFSGQSGVGKTSLINHLLKLNLKTAGIVQRTRKGSHTTSTAKLLPLEHEGFCIDTPGIKSFGLWQLDTQDLQHYFTEFKIYTHGCKFQNCTHIHEPDCGVKGAVETESISLLRYQSYYDLMTKPDEDWR